MFKDNARGKWSDYRGWFGTFIENVVQGTARDLLAAAIERFEARGIPIVLHRARRGRSPRSRPDRSREADFLAILLEPPAWAAGLPLAGKVWSGTALSRAAGGAADAAAARQWTSDEETELETRSTG